MSIYNENKGVYDCGKQYPPQIYNNIKQEFNENIFASSREIAKRYRVGKSFVCSVRNKMINGFDAQPKQRGGHRPARFKDPELDYLLLLYTQDNTRLLEEYREQLIPIYTPHPPPHISIISKALCHKLHLPRKKLTWLERKKYTDENMQYYQDFLGILADVNPLYIKSFDECHVDKNGIILNNL